ncbi:hypothetical protein HOC76_00605 [bacterium]|jgi:hypothetical protein|nr:hypothetical protein [bacterium]MBT6756567.1 hypothetical protein [Candidatus Paceibacterota bacterium]MBT7706597.1 hypothetical protein [archaeon]
MSDKIEFFAKIRWNVDFITEEIEKIPTSQKTKDQVLSICETISSDVLNNIGEIADEELIAEIKKQLARFHPLIQKLENNDNEKMAFMLLITHVADMLALIDKEGQK